MAIIQGDLAGIERNFTGGNAESEFQRIFGFSSGILRSAAVLALRSANETDDLHSQMSAAGSNFYHLFVSEVRASVDTLEGWSAKREDDNRTAPRAYRADGLGLAFVQGNKATGIATEQLRLKNKPGNVTVLELRQNTHAYQQVLPIAEFNSSLSSRPQTLWFAVYLHDEDSVRLEVALPAGVDDEGSIIGWDKRIVLDDVTMNDQVMEARGDERGKDDDVAVDDIAVAISEL
ncbi:MAG: hypothetical protein LKF49_10705 [Bifidobacterium tibiigranuli]|uniref:hypothetical protein n=1 Tax=Bifidobacterium tibiigranuli TaxID=2172043 RepID=UPI002357F7DA|nr:hypothetical protein [Bifidobacterium tibiigranuli]MCH3973603.1 hypothetical protein [Bifidobacterium tibiigranuli]MCH4189739.1 hypothetical protein [Bifidobacterium tibiigranuli]MCH4204652.1 hypothetical protein [Bifidobacterium tibiigranuli]MCH4275438.1 hypothetical protein [Bifidobacterium tibiigranuli]MCI1791897.1 hypothetical protein [Bifidobacterium tibiigranuli]